MAENYTAEQLNNTDKSLLVTMILNQQERICELQKQIESLLKQSAADSEKLQQILEQLQLSNRARFGRSSEKVKMPGQIAFMEVDGSIVFFNEAEAVCDLSEEEPQELTVHRAKKKSGKRDRDLSGLETNRIDHYMTDEELTKRFGENGWKQLPDQVTRKYHFQQAKVTVSEHHIGVYASKTDGGIIKAPHPSWLMPSSPVSPSLGAAIINAKYVNAVPLYRLEKEFERYGLQITRRSMANWMIRIGSDYLGILYDYLHRKLYEYHVIQADETTVRVNKDGRPANSTSYMWVYRSGALNGQTIVLYDYQKTRNTSHPREFLKSYNGICVTDGYQVYHTLEKEREELTIAGCWVHMRRRFYEALELIPKIAQKNTIAYLVVRQIQAIYREEGKLSELSSAERLKQRQVIIKPLVDALFVYLKQHKEEVSLKQKLGEAFSYALNQEKYLRVFLEDGEVPMDNNASERAIRGFTVGRKNWQMIDTINGAKASAIIYSIAETAKANNLKPYEYFEYLLTEIPKLTELKQGEIEPYLDRILPWSAELPEYIHKPQK